MKKIVWSCFILSSYLWAPIHAGQSSGVSTHTSQEKTRLGIGLAVEYMYAQSHLREDFTPFGNVAKGDRFHASKSFQVAPSIEIGVPILKDYYFGIFMSGRYSGSKTTSRSPLKGNTYFMQEFKVQYYIDVLAKAGYLLNSQAMVYGLIGPTLARWSHSTDQFESQAFQDRFKISKTSPGLALGFGFEYLFKKNMLLVLILLTTFSNQQPNNKT